MGQHFGSRCERIGADHKDSIVTLLMGSKLCSQPGQEYVEPKWFGHIVVRATIKPQNGIGIAVCPCQHDDRGFDARSAQKPTEIAAIHIRQSDI